MTKLTKKTLQTKHDWNAFEEALLDLLRYREQNFTDEHDEAQPEVEAIDTVRLMVLELQD